MKNSVTRSVAFVPLKFHLPLYLFKRLADVDWGLVLKCSTAFWTSAKRQLIEKM